MDNTFFYSYNEYDDHPIIDTKLHLGRRFMALLLCAIFLFPYIYYNIPNPGLPSYDGFLSLSDDGILDVNLSGSKNDINLFGNLKSGELQLNPTLGPKKSYHFVITTENAIITSNNGNLNILSYIGSDGINYTHIVCLKGYTTLRLYNSTESKGSIEKRVLPPEHEALIYSTEDKIGYVRFEADGTNPRPGHGIYQRPVITTDGVYEYIEIDPIDYEAFLLKNTYVAPKWDLDTNYELSAQTEDSDTESAPELYPSDFTLALSDLYYSKYIPWGEEETLLVGDSGEVLHLDNDSSREFPIYSRDIIVNDNLKTLGGEIPIYLNSLTIHENFPLHTTEIVGEVHVKTLCLVASSGRNENHLIKKDPENRVLPIRNYFRISEGACLFVNEPQT